MADDGRRPAGPTLQIRARDDGVRRATRSRSHLSRSRCSDGAGRPVGWRRAQAGLDRPCHSLGGALATFNFDLTACLSACTSGCPYVHRQRVGVGRVAVAGGRPAARFLDHVELGRAAGRTSTPIRRGGGLALCMADGWTTCCGLWSLSGREMCSIVYRSGFHTTLAARLLLSDRYCMHACII